MRPLFLILLPVLSMAFGHCDRHCDTETIRAGPESQLGPVWSPDGTLIVFTHDRLIYVAKFDGTSVRPLFEADKYGHADYSSSFSPDGSRLAFVTHRHRERINVREIGISDIDGSNYQRLTDNDHFDTNPVWSPDGSRLAFVTYAGGYAGIGAIGADGRDLRVLTPSHLHATGHAPVWSPDGRRIAFLAFDRRGEFRNPNLYTILRDGRDLRMISRATIGPAWSPDGVRIAFGLQDESQHRIAYATLYTARYDGTDIRQLVGGSLYRISPPVLWWSEDGSEVSFTSWDSSGHFGLDALNVDGSGIRRIARLDSQHVLVSWSPDGSRIAVLRTDELRDRDSSEWLYTLNAEGGGKRTLARRGMREGIDRLVAENSGWRIERDIAACSTRAVVKEPEKNPGLVRDCETLLRIGDVLDGPTLSINWGAETPMDDWSGVGVSGVPSRVRKLVLSPGLEGSIPSEISELTELETLRLGSRLSGPIPAELGELSNLVELRLYGNDLTGRIPSELGNLTKLKVLLLNNNDLSGDIPPELGNLNDLERLSLSRNRLWEIFPLIWESSLSWRYWDCPKIVSKEISPRSW